MQHKFLRYWFMWACCIGTKRKIIESYQALKFCCLKSGTILQEQVLNFIYDSYHDESGVLVVPESLRMKKDTSHREASKLKGYRTKNRYKIVIFVIKLLGCLLQRSKRLSLNVKAFCQPSWLFRYFGLDKQNPRVIKQWSYFFVHLNLNSLWEWPYRIQNETIFPLSEVSFQGPCLIIAYFYPCPIWSRPLSIHLFCRDSKKRNISEAFIFFGSQIEFVS